MNNPLIRHLPSAIVKTALSLENIGVDEYAWEWQDSIKIIETLTDGRRNAKSVCLVFLLGAILCGSMTGCSNSSLPAALYTASLIVPSTTPTPKNSRLSTPTSRMVNTQLPSVTAAFTPTLTRTLAPIPTNLPTQTPLTSEQIHTWVLDRLLDNGGCQLPCWWGTVPGETTWEGAKTILAPYASDLSEMSLDNDRLSGSASFSVSADEAAFGMGGVQIGFGVNGGVIQSMSIGGITLAPAYYLSELMTTYGEPESIWVNGYSPWGKEDTSPRLMTIHIFYPALGIFAQYSALGVKTTNGLLRNCITYGPFLILRSPEREVGYQDFIKTSGLNFEFPFKPAADVLGMNSRTFYDTYKGAKGDICIETSADQWVWLTPTPVSKP